MKIVGFPRMTSRKKLAEWGNPNLIPKKHKLSIEYFLSKEN